MEQREQRYRQLLYRIKIQVCVSLVRGFPKVLARLRNYNMGRKYLMIALKKG